MSAAGQKILSSIRDARAMRKDRDVQTVMKDAFEQAGYVSPEDRLWKLARETVRAGKSLEEFTLAVSEDAEVVMYLCAPILAQAQNELRSGKGQRRRTDGPETVYPSGTQANETRGAEGHSDHTDGRHIDTPGAARQSSGSEADRGRTTNGRHDDTRHRPGKAKEISMEAKQALRETAEKTVLDSFAIIDRNGERLPIGEIYVSSYDRLINMTAKRSWRASREYALLNLLKAETERRAAYIPPETKTREIFDAAVMERLLATATTLATPKLTESEAA